MTDRTAQIETADLAEGIDDAIAAACNVAIPGDWATVVEIANRPLNGAEFDATVLWCQALVAARSAALEEAAKVMDRAAQNMADERDRCGEVGDWDGHRMWQGYYLVAHEGSAAIRELKDK